MATKNTEDPDLEESETDDEEEEEEETVESLTAKLAAAKRESRKWEGRSKKNYQELQDAKAPDQSGKPDALKAAEAKGRDAALAEIAEERVHDAIETALGGRGLDEEAIEDILDTINIAKFLTNENRVDRERVSAYVDRVAPKRAKKAATKSDEDDEELPPGIPRRPRTAAIPAAAAGTRKPAPKGDRGKDTFASRYPNGMAGGKSISN